MPALIFEVSLYSYIRRASQDCSRIIFFSRSSWHVPLDGSDIILAWGAGERRWQSAERFRGQASISVQRSWLIASPATGCLLPRAPPQAQGPILDSDSARRRNNDGALHPICGLHPGRGIDPGFNRTHLSKGPSCCEQVPASRLHLSTSRITSETPEGPLPLNGAVKPPSCRTPISRPQRRESRRRTLGTPFASGAGKSSGDMPHPQ